jgi:hypothetical protein
MKLTVLSRESIAAIVRACILHCRILFFVGLINLNSLEISHIIIIKGIIGLLQEIVSVNYYLHALDLYSPEINYKASPTDICDWFEN